MEIAFEAGFELEVGGIVLTFVFFFFYVFLLIIMQTSEIVSAKALTRCWMWSLLDRVSLFIASSEF